MNFWILLALLFAAGEALAVWRENRRLEYFFKPAVMLCLLAFLLPGLAASAPLRWFALGIFFSLLGDLLLIEPDRFFLPGLAAFLLAHLAYIIGFNLPPAPPSALTFGLALFVALTVFPLIRRILLAMRASGQRALRTPVQAYATVITLMLLSALLTIFRTDWASGAALLAGGGAALFVASDVVLAWNKFVQPVARGKLLNILLYHLGQILLVLGVAAQFAH
ncbi:MAG: hypothetical protein OHK0031_11870 [Anaerolineales bacterium]